MYEYVDCSSGRAGGTVQRTIQSPLNGLHGTQAVEMDERKCTGEYTARTLAAFVF
jgi:hypothetical protein